MKVYMHIMKVRGEVLVAICDEDLLGKTLTEGNIRLDINEKFYGGRLVPIEQCKEAIDNSTITNIIGKRIVDFAISNGLVHETCLLWVRGIPHAQIIKV